MMQGELEKLGLSQIEAKVYVALIELGPNFAGKIVAKTKQHRQQVYDALKGLEARGLISTSLKNGKRIFHPIDPKRLYGIVREQESVLKNIVPLLENKFKSPKEEVVIYHGIDGFKTALQNRIDMTKSGEFVEVIGSTGKEFYEITKDFFDSYLGELRKKRSGIKWIIYKTQLDEFNQYFSKYLKINTTARLLTESQHTPVATTVLRDRVQISLFYPNPTIIEIRNQGLADEYHRYFEILWNKAIKIT